MAAINRDLEWLNRRTTEYCSSTDNAIGVVEDLDELGKLGRCFFSMDDLEEIDIGNGVVPRPTYVSVRLDVNQKQEIIELLKAYTCCFTWDYTEMSGLSWELVKHRYQLKPVLDRINRVLGTELSLSSRERMTLGVGEIFWFISHTLPQCHALQGVGDTYL
jgi:hypothetical protein